MWKDTHNNPTTLDTVVEPLFGCGRVKHDHRPNDPSTRSDFANEFLKADTFSPETRKSYQSSRTCLHQITTTDTSIQKKMSQKTHYNHRKLGFGYTTTSSPKFITSLDTLYTILSNTLHTLDCRTMNSIYEYIRNDIYV